MTDKTLARTIDTLHVSITQQRMTAHSAGQQVSSHVISTALAGPERKNSGCTPVASTIYVPK